MIHTMVEKCISISPRVQWSVIQQTDTNGNLHQPSDWLFNIGSYCNLLQLCGFKSQLCSISSKISGNMKNCHVILQPGLVSQTLQEDRSDVSNHPDRGDQHNPWIHHCYHIESLKETHRHLNICLWAPADKENQIISLFNLPLSLSLSLLSSLFPDVCTQASDWT